jgi:hypothetical protein
MTNKEEVSVVYKDRNLESYQKDGSMLMENKFRSICELCTALSFTAFGISVVFYPQNTNLYACMCSALIALFTLLANRTSDKDMIKKGIGTGKYTTWGKVFRCVSTVRLWLETVISGIVIFLVLAYFLTHSNQGNIFEKLAYYETTICIWSFLVVEWLLFFISLILLGIEKIVSGKNAMNSLLQ